MKDPIKIQPRDVSDPNIIPFNADTSGVGDVFVLMWLAAGLSLSGKTPVFIVDNEQRRDLVQSFGFQTLSALEVGWRGFTTEHCLDAERVDRMRRPRHVVWSEMIPGNPIPTRPVWNRTVKIGSEWVTIFPHCNWRMREMPLDFWIRVADMFVKNGDKVRFCVDAKEMNSAEFHSFRHTVVFTSTWNEVVHAVSMSKFVVGNDSGPMHAAMALGVPGAAAMITTKNVFTYTNTVAEIHVGLGMTPDSFVDALLARQVSVLEADVSRIGIPEYAMKLARIAAMRSEDPFRKVGAVGLTEDNRIVALAYNGLAPGEMAVPGFWEDREARRKFMIHAEQNLCSLVRRNEMRRVAVTTLPCESCASLLAAHGVREVFYADEYPGDSIEVLNRHGVKCTRVVA